MDCRFEIYHSCSYEAPTDNLVARGLSYLFNHKNIVDDQNLHERQLEADCGLKLLRHIVWQIEHQKPTNCSEGFAKAVAMNAYKIKFSVRQRLIDHQNSIRILPELAYKIGCLVLNNDTHPCNIEKVRFLWAAGIGKPSILNGMSLDHLRNWTNERKISWSPLFHMDYLISFAGLPFSFAFNSRQHESKVNKYSTDKKLLVSSLSYVDLGDEYHTVKDFAALISSEGAKANIRHLGLPTMQHSEKDAACHDQLFIDSINNLKNLTSLDITRTISLGISADALKKLAFPKLQNIHANFGSAYRNGLLDEFIKCHTFPHLIASCVTSFSLSLMPNMSFLQNLTLTMKAVRSLEDFDHFQKFANLSKLSIQCGELNNEALLKILLKLPMLETLVLSDSHEITHEGINSLQDYPRLKYIEIKNCKKVNKKELNLAILKKCEAA